MSQWVTLSRLQTHTDSVCMSAVTGQKDSILPSANRRNTSTSQVARRVFDERNQKVARATIGLLNEAGLDVGILGMQEGCSGDPARRAGNEYLFQMLAETNMMTFQELE